MSNKKRLIVIVLLISIAILLFIITKTFEKKLVNNIEIENNYEQFKRIDYYKKENINRYIKYYENNKNLSFEQIVTYVNIGLDYGFYNYIKKADIKKNNLVLVNKFNFLDKDYIPNNLEKINDKYFIYGNSNKRLLNKEAKFFFEKLSEDSMKNNTPVYGQSGYRSYEDQEKIYNSSKNPDVDTARSGHSEHQTGLAIDVSSTKNGNMLNFEKTNSFLWMQNNAYKYGFILRYPKKKENITGYEFESWHYRYVGLKVAKDMHDNYNNLTYDEYYYKFIDK